MCVGGQDLTGIDDMNRCRQILERHTWNIEVSCLLMIVVDDTKLLIIAMKTLQAPHLDEPYAIHIGNLQCSVMIHKIYIKFIYKRSTFNKYMHACTHT